MQDKNYQEKHAPLRRNQRSKEPRGRCYAQIGNAGIDRIAIQNENCQEEQAPMRRNQRTKEFRWRCYVQI